MLSRVPRHAHPAGFDLQADVSVPAADRARLEQVCRYLLRPAVAQDRLRLLADGHIVLTLKSAWTDGTRQLLFEPLTLLEKLAALILGRASIWCSTTACWRPIPAGDRVLSRTARRRRPWRTRAHAPR